MAGSDNKGQACRKCEMYNTFYIQKTLEIITNNVTFQILPCCVCSYPGERAFESVCFLSCKTSTVRIIPKLPLVQLHSGLNVLLDSASLVTRYHFHGFTNHSFHVPVFFSGTINVAALHHLCKIMLRLWKLFKLIHSGETNCSLGKTNSN